jgi:integrase/recombinase XerD
MKRALKPLTFAVLIKDFFCDRLLNQQNVSPHTVAAYRDTFQILLKFLQQKRGKSPTALTLDEINASNILAFLDDLESGRGNSVRTRNARLAAIRAFVSYASAREPTYLPTAQRMLAIPQKRFDRRLLGYLTRPEIEALANAPDQSTWSGRRDQTLFLVMYNTGIRVSEAVGLLQNDICLGPSSFVRIRGKGRKERSVPLWTSTAARLRKWLTEIGGSEQSQLFPNRYGDPLTRSGVENRLQRAVSFAVKKCPSLRGKDVSPHTLRHTTAMHLLQAGVDITVIALWLGHESTETTHQYVEADMEMKKRVLDQIDSLTTSPKRMPKADPLVEFLKKL